MVPPGACAVQGRADRDRYYERIGGTTGMRAIGISGHIPGDAENFSRERAGHFALVDDGDAIDQHVGHPLRELIGIVESGEVANGCRIEDYDIGPHACAEESTAFEAETLGGKRGKLADGVFQSELVLFAPVFAKDAAAMSLTP